MLLLKREREWAALFYFSEGNTTDMFGGKDPGLLQLLERFTAISTQTTGLETVPLI